MTWIRIHHAAAGRAAENLVQDIIMKTIHPPAVGHPRPFHHHPDSPAFRATGRILRRAIALAAVAAAALPPLARGTPAALGGGGYSQDFSGFVSSGSLPAEWQVSASGSDANKASVSVWGTVTTGIKSSGGTPLVNVLGYQHTENTDLVVKTLSLVNTTGSTITDLTVSYQGRLARPDSGRDPFHEVAVAGIPVPALRYSTADGDGASRQAAVGGLAIAPGDTFTITWTSNGDLAPGSGTRRQIGISQLVVQPGTAVFPPGLAALAVVSGSVTADSASLTATVQTDGGSPILQRGFVYAATADNAMPESGGSGVVTIQDGSPGTGPMAAALAALTDGTSYTVRAFAANAQGITYSPPLAFTTVTIPPGLVTTYAEPFAGFTGLPSLPKGWTAVSSGGFHSYIASWSSGIASGGFFGGDSSPGVLGYLHTGDTGTLTVTLTLRNLTGGPLTQLQVSYLGRVERLSNTRFPAWAVTVAGVPVPGLAYSTADGTDQTRSQLVTGLNIPAGDPFTITWVSTRGDGTGSSRRIGLADVAVSLPTGGSGYDAWKSVVNGQPPGEDFDSDGLPNGVEYFMGSAGNAFTSNPAVLDGKVTWARAPGTSVSDFRVEVSGDLVTWQNASVVHASNVVVHPDRIEFTLPDVPGPFFTRLSVTP